MPVSRLEDSSVNGQDPERAVVVARLIHDGAKLAAAGLDQRQHLAEPLFHPGPLHRLAEPAFAVAEVLHLALRDYGREGI
jgi:hypothetical protein